MDPLYGQKSTYPKKNDLNENWVVVNAENQILGRLASKVAQQLMGKDKPNFQPGTLVGDKVIITNAGKIRVTGNKMDQKKYHWHTGYFGGIKARTMREQMELDPAKIITHAIKGMLPKNKIGSKLLTRIRVFNGEDHGMEAQKPVAVTL